MKYIIRCGTREREFQGTPSEIMELKSSLDRTKELREAIKVAIENNNKKTETLEFINGQKVERVISND